MSDQSDPKNPKGTPKGKKPSQIDLSSAMALMAEQSDMLDDSDFAALSIKPKPEPPQEEPSALNDWEVPINHSPVLSADAEEPENMSKFSLSSIDTDELPQEDMMTGSVYDPELQQMLASGKFPTIDSMPLPQKESLSEPLINWEHELESEPEKEEDEFSLEAVEQALGQSMEPPLFVPPTEPEPAAEVPPAPLQALEDFQPPPLLLDLQDVRLAPAKPAESVVEVQPPIASPSPEPLPEFVSAPKSSPTPAPIVAPQPSPTPLPAPDRVVPAVLAAEDLLPPPPVSAPVLPVVTPPSMSSFVPKPSPSPAPPKTSPTPAPLSAAPIVPPRPSPTPAPVVTKPFIPPALPVDPLEAMLASLEGRTANKSSSIPLPMTGDESMFDDIQGTQVLTMDEIVEVIPVETVAPRAALKAPPLPPRTPPRPPATPKAVVHPFAPWVKLELASLESISNEQLREWLSIYSAEANEREAERGVLLYEAGEIYETELQDYASALACYRESAALMPSFLPARYGVLRLLFREKNLSAVEAQLQEATQNATGTMLSWVELERAFFLEGQGRPEAKSAYEAAARADATQLSPLLALARLQQGEPTPLQETLSSLVRSTLESNWKAAWSYLLSQHKSADLHGAEAALRDALQAEPSADGVFSALQRNLSRQEKFPELTALLLQEAEHAHSTEAAALLRVAAMLSWYQRGDEVGAWRNIEQALAHTPNDPTLLSIAALSARVRGNHEQSIELTKRLALTTEGSDQAALLLELSLAQLKSPSSTFDSENKSLFHTLLRGSLAEDSLRVLSRLIRRSKDPQEESALLLERRADSPDPSTIDVWLGLVATDPAQAKLHLASALSHPTESRYAALLLADLHKTSNEALEECGALLAALAHTTHEEEAAFLGFRAAYLSRFVLQDAQKYTQVLAVLCQHRLVSPREYALSLENAGRSEDAIAILQSALPESATLAAEPERSVAIELARLQESLQRKESAVHLYRRLEEAAPGDLYALLGLERCAAPVGLRAEAYERAAQKSGVVHIAFLHRSAALYLDTGRFADAARIYRSLIDAPEGSPLAALGLIASCRALQDEAALQDALSLVSRRDDELGALAATEHAAYLETHKQPAEAMALYEKAIQSEFPISSTARNLALALAARTNEWQKVEELGASILTSTEPAAQPQKRALRLTLASAYEATAPERAKGFFQEILNESPVDMLALRGALRCSLALNDKVSAAQYAIRIADQSTNATSLTERLLAIRLLDEAKQDGIAEQLTAALAQGKSDPAVLYTIESHRNKGALRNDLRQTYEARLGQVSPEEKAVYMLRLGELEAEAGKAAQGLPILEVAKERAPGDLATLLSARRVARLAENRTSFLKLSEALAAQLHEPKHIAAVFRESAALEESVGNVDAAEALVRKALEKHPGDKNLIVVQARILARRGNDVALHALLEKNPEALDDPSIALSLGFAQRRLGKKEEARRSLLRALSATPGDMSIVEVLFSIDRELGHHDEATELARRLLKRAKTDSEKALAEKRVAEASSFSSRRDEAIPAYLNYLRATPDDLQTQEQFLTFVREINRVRDGISYLESKYQNTTNKQEQRKIAERLGKYLDLELSQPLSAAEWYAKALSQDPLGAECGTRLVFLWKGKEERRLSALLEGTQIQLSESLRANPARWEIYRKLAEVFGWRVNRARYRAIFDLAHIVKLEDELPPPSAQLSPLTPPSRALTPDEMRQLTPQAKPLRELLIAVSEIFPKIFSKTPGDFDLGRRDRLRDGPGGERKKEIELIASRFNLKIYDAFAGGPDPNRCMMLQTSDGLIAIVGANLINKPISLETYFELGRAFTMACVGLLPILDADAAGLEGIFRGITWCADEKLRERDKTLPPNMARVAKAIYDAMPRRLKANHMEQFASLAQSFPKHLEVLSQELTTEADRGGLIMAGSLLHALRSIGAQPSSRGEEALGALLTRPRALSLLQYALTKEYEDLAMALSAI
jgi:hypothetical protein